jgi:ceramide glucosyltransferase
MVGATIQIVISWAAEVCLGGAVLGCLYLLTSCIAVLRFPHKPRALQFHPVPVSILKPLRGAEPGLSGRLASCCDQAYDAPVQVICGVEDGADQAVDAVRPLLTEHPFRSIELTVDDRQYGSNRKVSNLANMLPLARHNVTVMADSDIEVGPNYLANVTAELQRPGVGAVSCPYHGVAAAGLWSHYSALAINAHFLPNAIFALSFGLTRPCFGATVAMHRSILARIGAFRSFANCLADDYALGEAVRALGYEVAFTAFSVGHVCFERDLIGLLRRELRAARTIKSIDPLGYLGSILTNPLPLALIGLFVDAGNAMLLALAALACRIALCRCVELAFALPRQRLWLLPFRDLLSFAVFVSSYLGSTVTWRGARYDVLAEGRMVSDGTPAE